MRTSWIVGAWVALWAAPSLGAVGQITALEGAATRTAPGGEAQPLAVDAAVEVGDTLEVAAEGSLLLTLTDESVLMLGPASRLQITEAEFASLDDRRFSAKLQLGSLWAHVKRALVGSDAKFEVVTERAVAGVRGTIFEVEVAQNADLDTNVGVEEGEVEVLQVNEGVAADAPREKRFKRHRLKKGEGLFVKKKLAQKRKHLKKANRFRRFIERHRAQKRMERRQELRDRRRR